MNIQLKNNQIIQQRYDQNASKLTTKQDFFKKKLSFSVAITEKTKKKRYQMMHMWNQNAMQTKKQNKGR